MSERTHHISATAEAVPDTEPRVWDVTVRCSCGKVTRDRVASPLTIPACDHKES
jgi:hypothetical protein